MSILDIFKKKKKEEPKRIIDAVAVGLDPMFEDATRMVAQTSFYSISHLQRKLKIGYNQAERIEEELEYAGIIGPIIEPMVPREIMISETGTCPCVPALERCYRVPKKQIFYIHGRANSDDDLILGSGISSGDIFDNNFNGEYTGDEDHDNLISEVGRLKKPVCQIIHRNPQVFKKHEEIKAITIMGFSFSEIDIPYLQQLNTLNPQVVKWNLYFHSLEDLAELSSS